MSNKESSNSLLGLYVAAWVLAVIGWAGVLALILYTLPTVEVRWLFFVLGVASLTGTAVPFIRYLNRRFEHGHASSGVLLRRSIWVGVLGATLAWLQIERSLSLGYGLLLLGVLIAIELLLKLRERSQRVVHTTYDT